MEQDIKVGIADLEVGKSPSKLITIGLGSCVGIALYDKQKKIGGLAHVMLADSSRFNKKDNLKKFADTSIPILIRKLEALGADKSRLVAKIAGGAAMFNFSDKSIANDIGKKNVLMVEQVLKSNKIKIIGNETGGCKGRTMILDTKTGMVTIRIIGNGIKEI